MKNLIFNIERVFDSNRVRVWAIEAHPDHNIVYGYEGNGKLLKQKVDTSEGEVDGIKPLIDLPKPFFKDLVAALINERANLGVVPKEESFTKGKLEAAENHLNDLSLIVKKLLKINQ